MSEELKREPCADGEECPYCMEYLEGEYGHRRTCHYNFVETYIVPEDTQDDYPSECFVCDKCCNYVSRYVWEEYGPFEYCPLCGAKVVDDGR